MSEKVRERSEIEGGGREVPFCSWREQGRERLIINLLGVKREAVFFFWKKEIHAFAVSKNNDQKHPMKRRLCATCMCAIFAGK